MSTGQFHFFTGENIFALEQELLRWKKAFFVKHGQENYLELQARDTTLSDLLDAVSVMPFIAERRLVVLRGLPRIEKEDVKTLKESIHEQTVFVIAESKPDKRLSVTKTITTLAEKLEFKPLTPRNIQVWGRGVVQSCGATIGSSAWSRLIEIVGTDQWLLHSELRKISAYAKGEITEKHVEELAVPSGEQIIWQLTDLIGSRKPKEALTFLHARIERGEDPYGLWSVLLNMLKNLVLVWSALESGVRDERSISSAFSLHILSVRSLLPLVKSLKRDQVLELVRFASEADVALKTGGHQYGAGHYEEVIALAERAILYCA
jgi:DNA polymerase III delta subunit